MNAPAPSVSRAAMVVERFPQGLKPDIDFIGLIGLTEVMPLLQCLFENCRSNLRLARVWESVPRGLKPDTFWLTLCRG